MPLLLAVVRRGDPIWNRPGAMRAPFDSRLSPRSRRVACVLQITSARIPSKMTAEAAGRGTRAPIRLRWPDLFDLLCPQRAKTRNRWATLARSRPSPVDHLSLPRVPASRPAAVPEPGFQVFGHGSHRRIAIIDLGMASPRTDAFEARGRFPDEATRAARSNQDQADHVG